MFKGIQISELVNFFESHDIGLYHACQLKDLKAYLSLGGIPSRNLLEKSRLDFTPFDTDKNDKRNRIWGRVSFNLDDFGAAFANRKNATPNAYGPIQFVFNAKVLLEVDDISLTLQSMGGQEMDRIVESLCMIKEVKKLFEFDLNEYGEKVGRIKKKYKLKKIFFYKKVTSPEMNCTIPNQIASFQHLSYLIVDPYDFSGRSLTDITNDLLNQHKIEKECKTRIGGVERMRMYNYLLEQIRNGVDSVNDLMNYDRYCKKWIDGILENKLDWQFSRYAQYLREGTIKEVDK